MRPCPEDLRTKSGATAHASDIKGFLAASKREGSSRQKYGYLEMGCKMPRRQRGFIAGS
ncbi:protein of unknown function [Hyphomicrobium sp. MC1]|nr:protein of unknown function [Hyphomicrobium sp. MC1]